MQAEVPRGASAFGSMKATFHHALLQLTLGSLVGLACGLASAVFLTGLALVTSGRESQPWLVGLLPFGGWVLGWGYDRLGRGSEGGTSLVLETWHTGGPPLPRRMAPLVLLGTWLTHLVGGSAGREGTAVQMGASLGESLGRLPGLQGLRRAPKYRETLLVAGMAGGFGSVFGTPWAGALFALEVLTFGELALGFWVSAVSASLVGDYVTRALGVRHGAFPAFEAWHLTPGSIGRCLLLALALAFASRAYLGAVSHLKVWSAKLCGSLRWRLAVGGLGLWSLCAIWGFDSAKAHLGLSLPLLKRAFVDPDLPASAFALKLGFTALTLGVGFIGGEVTPLFVAGACLGNVVGRALGLPPAVAAGLGMGGLFAAASNAPLALALMTAELFGLRALPLALLVGGLACLGSGHRGLHPTQRVRRLKTGRRLKVPRSWRELESARDGALPRPRPGA